MGSNTYHPHLIESSQRFFMYHFCPIFVTFNKLFTFDDCSVRVHGPKSTQIRFDSDSGCAIRLDIDKRSVQQQQQQQNGLKSLIRVGSDILIRISGYGFIYGGRLKSINPLAQLKAF